MNMGYLKLYTREPEGEEYPSGLAYSIHFSYSMDGVSYTALNQNYGMLFAEGEIAPDNTIIEKGVRYPGLLTGQNAGYGILAIQVNADGTEDLQAKGTYPYWISEDLVQFTYKGLCTAKEIAADRGISAEKVAEAVAQMRQSGESVTAVSADLLEQVCKKWLPVRCIRTEVPQKAVAGSLEEVNKITAKVIYSDGSCHEKKVVWDTAGIDFKTPGSYRIKGMVERKKYAFPLAVGYADPVIFPYQGKWYFLATNDNTDDVGIFVRCADTIPVLFAEETEEFCILEYNKAKQWIQTFWAPEFHIIGGRLYILFAVSGDAWGPQCHMMRLKEGGSIIRPDDWEEPIRVRRENGSMLCENGITLDMTYLKVNGKSYVVWSERYQIGTKLDSGSMLYIAAIDEEEPWILKSEPVLLSRPLYGWENQYGTINNEGPYVLYTKDTVYLAYSGGSANGYSYVVGFLTISVDGNLLNAAEWRKSNTPVLSAYSVEGEYGPGHNSFYTDEEENVWIAYHAKTERGFATRSTAIRRVHFDMDGIPLLNMSAERDLGENMREVTLELQVSP